LESWGESICENVDVSNHLCRFADNFTPVYRYFMREGILLNLKGAYEISVVLGIHIPV
jgi:hypothetical protein